MWEMLLSIVVVVSSTGRNLRGCFQRICTQSLVVINDSEEIGLLLFT